MHNPSSLPKWVRLLLCINDGQWGPDPLFQAKFLVADYLRPSQLKFSHIGLRYLLFELSSKFIVIVLRRRHLPPSPKGNLSPPPSPPERSDSIDDDDDIITMNATTSLFRAARPAFRQSAFGAHRAAFQSQRANAGRRWQSTTAETQQSWFSRMWNSPIGFKTVHFWAPVMKWALVLAGVSDFARPAEKLSLTQNGALTATGLIWTRWCFVITPKNYLLAAVNFFLGVVGVVQCSRIIMWHQSQKNLPATEELKEKAEEKVEAVKAAVKSQ